MRTAAFGDVLKVVLYVVASFILAAITSPHLYEVGKAFAHVALTKDTADRVAWLAAKAERADFDTYFKHSLLLSAVFLLIPLFYSLKLGGHSRAREGGLWSINSRPILHNPGQALGRGKLGVLQTMAGFLITAGFFFLMAWFLLTMNWFEWKREPTSGNLFHAMGRAIKSAIGVSIIEEWFFRGALLGIFLRAFRPSVAIISLSLLFAATHFLVPPANSTVTDPRNAMAGFEMLSLIGQRFLQAEAMMTSFITLFLVGVVLGVARYGTASLWLPIGLHAGWVFSTKVFDRMTMRRSDFPDDFKLYIGERVTEGAIPIAFIILTGAAVASYLRFLRPRDPGSIHNKPLES